MEGTFGMEDTYELDRLIGASPASASVLHIIAASGSRTLTKEASAEEREAVGEVISVERILHFCKDLTGMYRSFNVSSKVALEFSEEAFEEASTSEAAFLVEVGARTAGAKEASDDGLPNHLYEGSLMDQGPSASFLGNNQGSQVAQDGTSSTRQNY